MRPRDPKSIWKLNLDYLDWQGFPSLWVWL
jgi:hypothetical protein